MYRMQAQDDVIFTKFISHILAGSPTFLKKWLERTKSERWFKDGHSEQAHHLFVFQKALQKQKARKMKFMWRTCTSTSVDNRTVSNI